MNRVREQEMLARFSENVRAARMRRRLSQEELAFRAEVHRTQIHYIEDGKRGRSPRLPTLVALAGALEVPIDGLFEGISYTPAITTLGGFVVESPDVPPGRSRSG